MCDSHCTDRPELARVAGSSTIPTGIDHSINPERLGALGFIGVHAVSVESDHCRLVWQARSCVCVENALLVLCMGLYGPVLLHVLRVHAFCGHCG